MRAIFISYRRSDSEGEAGRLSDVLTARFTGQSVFMDVDSIKPGRDFRRAIEESVQNCSVLLAIIGPAWLDTRTDGGGRRLDAPNDYVRLEIAAALRRDIAVIPVLVRGARMPQPDQLPPDIQELAYRNSVELTHARWRSDLQILTDALEPLLAPAAQLRAAPPAPMPVRPPAPQTAAFPLTERPHLTPRTAVTLPPRRPPASPFARIPDQPRPAAPARIPAQHPPAPSPPPEPVASVAMEPPAANEGLFPRNTERVSKELAHYIGPIAEIVVKRAARTAATLDALCIAVAHEIESPGDRAAFLQACHK